MDLPRLGQNTTFTWVLTILSACVTNVLSTELSPPPPLPFLLFTFFEIGSRQTVLCTANDDLEHLVLLPLQVPPSAGIIGLLHHAWLGTIF